EAIGKTSVDLNLWVDLDVRTHFLAQLGTQGTVHAFETELRRKNGAVFTALYSGSTVTIGGQPYGLAIIQDIEARKQSVATRDRAIALMRATFESTADGILVVNAAGRIETFNQNFIEMWNLTDTAQPPDPLQA